MAMKVIKLSTVPVGLMGLVSLRVYAATQEKPRDKQLLPSQLSIYSAPPKQTKYIEEQPGSLQLTLSCLRNAVHPYVAWCKRAYSSIERGIGTTVQFGKDSYVYLKNPPPEFLPKMGVITVSGLAGLVLARKGSQFKKIAYPLGLTTLGLSVCYPAQTVIFAKVAGKKGYAASHWGYKTVGSLWRPNASNTEVSPEGIGVVKHIPESIVEKDHEVAGTHISVPKNEVNSKPLEIPAVSASLAEKTKITIDTVPLPVEISESETKSSLTLTQDEIKNSKFKPDPKLLDHGQSNPEDTDMYSTRS